MTAYEMTPQEWRMAHKYARLNAGVTGKVRERLIYEIEHFRNRLERKGMTLECYFSYTGPSNYIVRIGRMK